MFDLGPEVIALLIPIIAVLGAFGTAIASIIIRGKERELEHQERLIAMEKGIPIPEPKKEKRPPRYLAVRAWGLVMTLLGLALVVAISLQTGIRYGAWGLLPLAIGLGLIMAAGYEKRELAAREKSEL